MAKKMTAMVMALLFLCVSCVVFAEEQVSIVLKKVDYTTDGMDFEVELAFADKSWYNDSIFLSYHILDEQGTMLRFENERFPVTLQGKKTKPVEVRVDCSQIPELEEVNEAWIQFDLVDSENLYWFRDKGMLNEENASVLFERSRMEPGQSGGLMTALDVPAVILNMVTWAVLLYFLWKFRPKSKKNAK